MTFLESDEAVPRADMEDDKLNFRDNLQLAINHSNRSRVNVIEKHLEVKYSLLCVRIALI